GFRRDRLQAMQRTEMLEVDAVRDPDPRIQRARPAEVRLVAQIALVDVGNARDPKQRCVAVERPDESPGFRARIRPDPGARRDFVAGRNVDTPTVTIESPVMIGAADLAPHELAD